LPLRQLQRRRELSTCVTQRPQILLQNRVISPVLRRGDALSPPLALRWLTRIRPLHRLPSG
jgi:hypothetical protein